MISKKSTKHIVKGGYDSFTDRGGFEDIYVTYDSEILRYFLDGAKILVNELDLKGYEAILDIGTGTGHTALELANRYPKSKVVGIDSSTGMLSQAILKKKNRANIQFFEHDWDKLQELPGTFDVILNSFGISFVKDIEKFALSVKSKIKKNSIFGFINFDDGGFEPFIKQMFADLQLMSFMRKIPSLLSPANIRLIKIMKSMGFETLKDNFLRLEYTINTTDEWWTVVSRTAIKENFIYELNKKEIEEFKVAHLNNIQQMIDNGINKYVVPVRLYIGRA